MRQVNSDRRVPLPSTNSIQLADYRLMAPHVQMGLMNVAVVDTLRVLHDWDREHKVTGMRARAGSHRQRVGQR